MKVSTPVVFCAKKQEPAPLILSGCGLADAQSKYSGGDKTKFATDVEKAWLRVYYPQAPRPFLLAKTMRSHWMTVVHIANAMGVIRGENLARRKEAAARAHARRQKRGMIFNAEQSAYIEACFARDYWPRKHFGREPLKSQSEAIRADLIANVAALDEHSKVWTWDAIRSHMKWVSPSYQNNMAARNAAKRARAKAKVNG